MEPILPGSIAVAKHAESATKLLCHGVILHLPVIAEDAQSAAIETRKQVVRSWIVTHFPVSVDVGRN